MANVVYCNTNDLCQNNYYFALSTPSSCNPINLPTSHTGIANSGASGIYFASNAPVANLNPTAYSVGVRVANGLPMGSVASAMLASAPSLPPAAMQGHVMPSFPHTPLPILAARLFSPSMLSWSSIRMATASLMDGANKMALASGASLSRPPCQSRQNLPTMRSRVHVEAPPIPNAFPPARRKPPSQACWRPRCLKNMRKRAHMEALPIFLSRLLLTQFSAPLHIPCLPRPVR
jgi:hypothetical protein